MMDLASLRHSLEHATFEQVSGRVVHAVGPLLEAELPGARVGAICSIEGRDLCEVVGFRDRRTLLMPLDAPDGVNFGARVTTAADSITVAVGDELIGRVVDGLGNPIDGKGPLQTRYRRRVRSDAPHPLGRALIDEPLHTGIRAIDSLIPMGRGQRMCVIAGSGVGKSTLLGMVARHVHSDVNVICLIGERGREIREFIEHNLGEEGMARSVVVAVTSDKSPAMIIKGAMLATTIAEHFRSDDRDVLLLMDSLTRLALAQRQIGLAAGEPPTTRGYTPSVFALLPPLLERAGPDERGGSISALYTVLVEGDDINDPIADAVRGIVDGHIVLSRKLATHGHYPAIDVLGSLSRLADRVTETGHIQAARRLRDILATWSENEELIRLGAYRPGSSLEVDRAIALLPDIQSFLRQEVDDATDPATLQKMLETLFQRVQNIGTGAKSAKG